MKRKDFLKSLGIGSLLLVPGVKSATDEPKIVEKKVYADRNSLIPQARYRYKNYWMRYLSSSPNDYAEWEHKFFVYTIDYSTYEQYQKDKELFKKSYMLILKDDDLENVIYIERMYPPKA